MFAMHAMCHAHAEGFRRTSKSRASSDESSVPISGMYSHRDVRGKLIRMLSIRADGVASPNLVPRSYTRLNSTVRRTWRHQRREG